MKPLPRTYDALFEAEAPMIPVAFMRALAWMESGFNPRNVTGAARGLMQVIPEVLADYNAAHGTGWTAEDMFNAEKNVRVFSWTIDRIRTNLNRHGINEDWHSPFYVRLLLASWNSGWSDVGGTGKVLKYLASKGIPITFDNVYIHAKAAGATTNLQNGNSRAAAKYKWQIDTAAVYAGDAAAAGDAAMLADLGRWATKRVTEEQLRPPGTATSAGGQVAATTTPMPAPERAQGKTEGAGLGWLLLALVAVLVGSKRR